ncbi:MAG: prephenate dehydrogenase [Clostridiales bacterium]|nr:prephenate dehydrogenase [Clostridiales bacterium]
MDNKSIAIIGLGLIGGSLAKALRRTNHNFYIIGMDRDEKNCQLAQEDGSVDIVTSNLEEAVKNAHVIFLCMPISSIPEMLRKLAPLVQPGTILTDVGSIKTGIMKEAEQVLPKEIHFIGGHPMAGREHSGYAASIAHLFENAYYVLTPRTGTPPSAVKDLQLIIASTGALPLVLDPIIHDIRVGAVSHLPHIIAATLVNTVEGWDGPDKSGQKLAAGGFKDITRIASSQPEMWRDISLSNKEQLLPMISDFINKLNRFKQELESNNEMEIGNFYMEAKNYRDKIPSSDSLYLLPYYKVYVDIEDRPGSIGEVASFLGDKNVNIKNMQIINSREDEPGCLVVSVEDKSAQGKAVSLLNQSGFYAYTR